MTDRSVDAMRGQVAEIVDLYDGPTDGLGEAVRAIEEKIRERQPMFPLGREQAKADRVASLLAEAAELIEQLPY